MKPIIRVANLSKQYRIGARPTAYQTLRESLVNVARTPLKWFNGSGSSQEHMIWALKDINFEVQPGEVVGIIGRNGAGKSTLLKILSRITQPTTGQIDLYGRVGSLLEVGTGFHAELTGRENIYLNGAILGMKRREIERRFDEIVTFAEVEKFLDTPVKHYSSGMYLRLAFAVAAHLEPEILIVDEVLAVGDATFQKKCLGKMSDVAREGRTVLFVSHSMPAVQSLCDKGVVLAGGQVRFYGAINQAVNHYLTDAELQTGVCDLTSSAHRAGSGEMRLVRFWVEDKMGAPMAAIPSGSQCSFAVEYVCPDRRPRRDVFMGLVIYTLMGAPVAVVNTHLLNQDFATVPPTGIIRFKIPKLPLTAGRYVLDLYLAIHQGATVMDHLKSAVAFDVSDGDFYGTGRAGNRYAPVMIEGSWQLDEAPGP